MEGLDGALDEASPPKRGLRQRLVQPKRSTEKKPKKPKKVRKSEAKLEALDPYKTSSFAVRRLKRIEKRRRLRGKAFTVKAQSGLFRWEQRRRRRGGFQGRIVLDRKWVVAESGSATLEQQWNYVRDNLSKAVPAG